MSTTVRTSITIHHPNAPEVRVRSDVADDWRSEVQPVHLGWGTSHFELETAPGQEIHLKPTLQGEWVQGSDIHVHAGQSVDLYPVFERNQGEVKTLFHHFDSQRLGNHRDIYAYLPPGYAHEPGRRYPVLLVNDGQKVFSGVGEGGQSWELEKTLDAMIAEGKIPPVIAVGVSAADRWAEYGDERGDDYQHFLFDELLPQVHGHLRTLVGAEHTSLLGSSMGGRSALSAGLRRPEALRRVAAMSPTTTAYPGERYADSLASGGYDPHALERIYIDNGLVGPGDLDDDTGPLVNALWARGVGDKLMHWYEDGARHGEYYWSQRVGRALQHLLG